MRLTGLAMAAEARRVMSRVVNCILIVVVGTRKFLFIGEYVEVVEVEGVVA